MKLKTIALVAAILQGASSLLGLGQYLKVQLEHSAVMDSLTQISWPLGILAGLSVSFFLFSLFLKQK